MPTEVSLLRRSGQGRGKHRRRRPRSRRICSSPRPRRLEIGLEATAKHRGLGLTLSIRSALRLTCSRRNGTRSALEAMSTHALHKSTTTVRISQNW